MALFHSHVQVITRGKGKSAVASAAYQAGETIKNEYDGITHDYTRVTTETNRGNAETNRMTITP